MGEEAARIGTLRKVADGRYEGSLSRVYEGHTPAELWKMLTEPGNFAQWLAPGTMELRKGGAVRISFEDSGIVIDSTLLEYEPEKLLAYSWSSGDEPERPLRWQIAKAGDDVRLDLTVLLPGDADIAKACAGFEGHLEMLGAALEGVPVKFPLELYLAARESYKKQLGS